ncbi:MAG: hypothetical protein BRC34_12645 [Cyanobacteria bacterium QH_1_48_107]|nr:MAG: hypothetical protein BRC34_12645 [Cyanobacteria bacterium QH_1_48_107]
MEKLLSKSKSRIITCQKLRNGIYYNRGSLELNSQNVQMSNNSPKNVPTVPVVTQLIFLKMEAHIIKSLSYYVKSAVASLLKTLKISLSILRLKKPFKTLVRKNFLNWHRPLFGSINELATKFCYFFALFVVKWEFGQKQASI